MMIAHLADVHLGARKYGERAIYEDVREAFERSVDEIARERPEVIIIAGDLFDSPHPDNEVLRFAVSKFKELGGRGFKVVAAHGEHDTPGTAREPSILSVLASAIDGFAAPRPRPGVKDLRELVEDTTVSVGPLKIFVYPFVKTSIDERRRLASGLLRLYGAEVSEARRGGAKAVFVAHFSLQEVFPFDYVASISDLPRADYVALGHVHTRCIACMGRGPNGVTYAYPGSLYPLDIVEVEAQKQRNYVRGPLLVDLSSDEPVVHEVKVDVRAHEIAEASLTDPTDIEGPLRRAVAPYRGRGGKPPIVHLRLSVSSRIPMRLVESKANKVGSELGLIIIPHVTRVLDEGARGAGARARPSAEALSPEEVLRQEVGLDDFTAKLVMELIRAAEEGSDEEIDKVLSKMSGWEPTLRRLREVIGA